MINGDVVVVTFQNIVSILANDQITFNVYNVQNPISTTPTSPFSNIQIMTTAGYLISDYT